MREGHRFLRGAQPIGDLAQATHGIRLRRPHLKPGCPGFAQILVHHPPADLTTQQLDALLLGLRLHLLTDALHLSLVDSAIITFEARFLEHSSRLLQLSLQGCDQCRLLIELFALLSRFGFQCRLFCRLPIFKPV